jgi:hypothetical protein
VFLVKHVTDQRWLIGASSNLKSILLGLDLVIGIGLLSREKTCLPYFGLNFIYLLVYLYSMITKKSVCIRVNFQFFFNWNLLIQFKKQNYYYVLFFLYIDDSMRKKLDNVLVFGTFRLKLWVALELGDWSKKWPTTHLSYRRLGYFLNFKRKERIIHIFDFNLFTFIFGV